MFLLVELAVCRQPLQQVVQMLLTLWLVELAAEAAIIKLGLQACQARGQDGPLEAAAAVQHRTMVLILVLVRMARMVMLSLSHYTKMPYIDQNGLNWTRSDDRMKITCDDGRVVMGNEEMTDEYMVSLSYYVPEPEKSDAERIAELEAKLAALIAKLS